MDVSSLSNTSALWASSATSSATSSTSSARGPEKTMQSVADLLGMDVDSVKEALKGGKTMADVASSAGISTDDLVATIAATLPAQGPDGVPTDKTAMATTIASGQLQGPPPKPPVDASGGMDALSSALGVSSTELLQRLTDGTGIADLLQDNPQVAAQLAAAQNKGAVVDGYA